MAEGGRGDGGIMIQSPTDFMRRISLRDFNLLNNKCAYAVQSLICILCRLAILYFSRNNIIRIIPDIKSIPLLLQSTHAPACQTDALRWYRFLSLVGVV